MSEKNQNIKEHYVKPIGTGLGMTLVTTPATFYGNYYSNIMANNQLSFGQATHIIKKNPMVGMGWHLGKEFARTAIKVPLSREVRPIINQLGKENDLSLVADGVYGAIVAVATEVPLNPLEAKKVRLQNNSTTKGLMSGALTGVIRQAPAWFLWTFTWRKVDEHYEAKGENPHNLENLLPRTAVVTLGAMLPVYPITRLRYEMQTKSCANTLNKSLDGNRYTFAEAIKSIVKSQGIKGIGGGFVGKLVCNSASTFGTLLAAGYGKRDGDLGRG